MVRCLPSLSSALTILLNETREAPRQPASDVIAIREYGYEKFEIGEIGSRSYKLDRLPNFSSEKYCIRFYYYLSGANYNGSVNVDVLP